jgi:hypothetical protein
MKEATMRKPIHLELAGGKSQRQRIWELIRKYPFSFSQMDVTPGGVPDDTARDYLRGLTKAGYIEVLQQPKPNHTQTLWRLMKDPGAEAPRVRKNGEAVTQGHGNEAIWGAMQALGVFTYRVLAEMSGATMQTVKSYCVALQRAGYLTVEQPSKHKRSGGTDAKYRLLKSKVTGPRPPMITRLKAVYDPNIHQIVWQQDADDALEAMEAA